MRTTIELLSVYERNRQMVDMGAYRIGSNPVVDRAIQVYPAIRKVLQQSILESTQRSEALSRLRIALGGGNP